VVTLIPLAGDADLYGSLSASHLDQLPNPPAGTMKSCRALGLVEKLTFQATQNGVFYVAGYGATECAYRISVSTQAKATISASRRDVISGGSIHFDGKGSTPSGAGGTIVSYNWAFSDGSSATGTVVDHVFYYSGSTQFVTLTVTDSLGATSQSSLAINVTGTSQGITANKSGQSPDPVNMATGNFSYSHTDLVVPGRGMPFVFARSYNSRDPYFRTGRPLGHGWTHSYNLRMVQESESQVTVIFPDGHGVIFTAAGNGTYIPEKGFHHRLERASEGGGHILTTKEQLKYFFDANLRLDRIEDRNSNAIQCVYDPAGKLSQIVDTVGRVFSLAYDPAGRLISLTDPASRVLRYTYSGPADLASFTDPEGNTIGYGYDDLHQLTTVTDPKGVIAVHMVYDELSRVVQSQSDVYGNTFLFSYDFETGITFQKDPLGNETVYAHDDQMRLVSLKHPDGYAEYFEYDEDGNRTAVTDKRGYTTRYAYDGQGNVTSKAEPSGCTVTIEYDVQNNPVRRTDQLGAMTAYTYDPKGNLTKTTDALGYETIMEYDEYGQLISKTAANGRVALYSYDLDGNLVEAINPLGNRTSSVYDRIGRKVSSTDPSGGATSFIYDKNDKTLSMTDPGGNKVRFEYDAAGNRTRVIDPLGRAGQNEYDLKNRLARTINPSGAIRTFVYDALDQLIRKTLPLNNTWTTTYNPVGKPEKQRDPLGHETLLAYDPNANLEARTDPSGNATFFSYDEQNRKTAIQDPLGNFERTEYDDAGRLVKKVDALGRSTCFQYDPLGRLTKVTDAAGGQTVYEYDPVGNLTGIKTPSGSMTTMEYDLANRLIHRTDPMEREESFSYDVSGRLISKTMADHRTIYFEYDPSSRPIRILYPDGQEVTFAYDAAGNRITMQDGTGLTQWEYDENNRVTRYRYKGLEIGYSYDLNSNRTSIAYPGAKVVQYRYDLNDRLNEVVDWLGQTTRYTYDANGRLKEVVLPNGSTAQYGYDQAGRLESLLNHLANGTLLSSHQFTLDRSGNIVRENGIAPLEPGGEDMEQDSLYDPSNRLLEAGTTLFDYDEKGNLLRKTKGGVATEYRFDAADRLVGWQRENQNKEFRYDGLGNRVGRTLNGITTNYIWDLNSSLPKVIAETDGTGNITKYYIYGLGLIETISASGQASFYHYDSRGNTIAVTNLQGEIVTKYAYDDFGKVSNQWGDQNDAFRFLGRYGVMTEDDLYHIRARYYDPDSGRFISPDPLTGNHQDPRTLNRYVYALNNPGRFVDVTGLCAQKQNKFVHSESISGAPDLYPSLYIGTGTAGSTPSTTVNGTTAAIGVELGMGFLISRSEEVVITQAGEKYRITVVGFGLSAEGKASAYGKVFLSGDITPGEHIRITSGIDAELGPVRGMADWVWWDKQSGFVPLEESKAAIGPLEVSGAGSVVLEKSLGTGAKLNFLRLEKITITKIGGDSVEGYGGGGGGSW
jgi:RHS repeat-associated protein